MFVYIHMHIYTYMCVYIHMPVHIYKYVMCVLISRMYLYSVAVHIYMHLYMYKYTSVTNPSAAYPRCHDYINTALQALRDAAAQLRICHELVYNMTPSHVCCC